MFSPGLNHGETISNQELANIFKCGTQGGMRKSNTTNTLVLISDHTKSLYEDRWEDNILHYVGMGRIGDQSLMFMQNKTLNESITSNISIYLFEVFNKNEYRFVGPVSLEGTPYQEKQLDEENNERNVWVFPLKVLGNITPLSLETLHDNKKRQEKRIRRLSDDELYKRAKISGRKSGKRNVTSITYERDPYVTEYAKRRAKGICQLCEKEAPFKNKNDEPYLETHHIKWLSRNGADSIENTVALCPNCHRKMHVLDLEEDVEKLKLAVERECNITV
ncbi:HNH endonuclease [Brevibacillus halotolerans]|uniref:HNH endonuclease n=1 Tax=Brevibacillus halotolerans TaxID=1507437 RepID=UPI001FE354ED|nr:HNH endonuclease [Brevibacillus halotolerans]